MTDFWFLPHGVTIFSPKYSSIKLDEFPSQRKTVGSLSGVGG